jgi:hypothetical protein
MIHSQFNLNISTKDVGNDKGFSRRTGVIPRRHRSLKVAAAISPAVSH